MKTVPQQLDDEAVQNNLQATNPPETYQYESLGDTKKFRIILLHPGQSEDPIKCKLEGWDLDKSPLYTAISYRWDNNTEKKDMQAILIDEKQFLVRPNVVDILRSCRQPLEHRRLWIDAISINQEDNEERRIQVPLMGEIYSQASYSIAWISDSDTIGLGHTIHVANCYINQKKRGRNPCSSCVSLGGARGLEASITKFFQNEYWNRRWIIQEVVLANSIEVHCGGHITPLSNLAEFAEDMLQGVPAGGIWNNDEIWNTRYWDSPLSFQNSLPLRLQNDRLRLSETTTLRDLLHRYQSSKCSELNDKIFALLSLSPTAVAKFKVDYQMSSEDLLLTVIRFCHTHEKLMKADVIQLGNLLVEELELDLNVYSTLPHTPQSVQSNPFQDITVPLFCLGSARGKIPVNEEFNISELRQRAKGLIKYPTLKFKSELWNYSKSYQLSKFGQAITFLGQNLEDNLNESLHVVAANDLCPFTCTFNSEYGDITGLAPIKIRPDHEIFYVKGTKFALIGIRKHGDLSIIARAYLANIPKGLREEDNYDQVKNEYSILGFFRLNLELFVHLIKWTGTYGEDRRV